MDILSHALWAAAVKKIATTQPGSVVRDKDVSTRWTMWWGVFPDLFAFVPMYILGLWTEYNTLGTVFSSETRSFFSFEFAWGLYQISHSFVTFLVVFGLVILVKFLIAKLNPSVLRAPRIPESSSGQARSGAGSSLKEGRMGWKKLIPYSLLGWPFHILLDIPTHTTRFFPTPFLWPISDYKFLYGFSWGQPWFLITNLVALIFMYTWLWRRKKMKDAG